jgi:hypothetical protein
LTRFLQITLLALILSACASTRFVCPDVPDIPRPGLPSIEASEVQCLTDETWNKLVQRERARREYAEELEAVLDAIGEECQ